MTRTATSPDIQLHRRLAYLDALRGFAALYVVMHHVALMPTPPLLMPDWLRHLIGFGGSGVTLFFIISGFSMCLTWSRYNATTSPIKSFYISRFVRIAPLFYFWLMLAILRDAIFKGPADQHSVIEIGANILFIFNLYEPFQAGIVWASWTIGVEMLFYAIFPFIKLAGFNNLLKTLVLLVLSVAIAVIARSGLIEPIKPDSTPSLGLFDNVGFFVVLSIFLMGMVTYYVDRLFHASLTCALKIWLGRLLLPLAIVALIFLGSYNPDGLAWYYVSAVIYGVLLLGFSGWGKIMIINSFTCYLGRISYSLYLNHPTVVYLLMPVYLAIYKIGLESGVTFFFCVIVTVCILVPISQITYRFIESPVMLLHKKRSPIYSK